MGLQLHRRPDSSSVAHRTIGKVPAPRFDPNFGRLGEVMVRDLALYEAASQSEGGEV